MTGWTRREKQQYHIPDRIVSSEILEAFFGLDKRNQIQKSLHEKQHYIQALHTLL